MFLSPQPHAGSFQRCVNIFLLKYTLLKLSRIPQTRSSPKTHNAAAGSLPRCAAGGRRRLPHSNLLAQLAHIRVEAAAAWRNAVAHQLRHEKRHQRLPLRKPGGRALLLRLGVLEPQAEPCIKGREGSVQRVFVRCRARGSCCAGSWRNCMGRAWKLLKRHHVPPFALSALDCAAAAKREGIGKR